MPCRLYTMYCCKNNTKGEKAIIYQSHTMYCTRAIKKPDTEIFRMGTMYCEKKSASYEYTSRYVSNNLDKDQPRGGIKLQNRYEILNTCLLYTSDAADE